jgi:hypothetical protein
MSIVWISLWAAALLLLPGWAIWRLVGPRDMSPALQIAPAFALSMAVISVLAWSGYVLGIGFSGVKTVAIAVIVLAVLGSLAAFRFRRSNAIQPVLPRWTLWAVYGMAVAAALSALYSGFWLSATADSFYHLTAVRSILEHGTTLPKEVFFSEPVPAPDPTSGAWHLAVALVANLSGQDPLTVWRVMTVALAPLMILGFFTLALSIIRSGVPALIACALYVVLALAFDFRNVANPNQFGDVLAWLALAFAFRFVDSGARRELVVAVPIAFAASAVHGALSPFLLVALAGAVGAAIVVRSPSWRRLAIAAAVVSAAAIPLLVVDASTLAASVPYAAKAVRSPLPFHVIHHPWSWIWPANWYDNPATVLGTAFAVSLVRLWRAGEAGAALVIAAMLVIPVAAVTPLFATTYSGQYLFARVAFVLQPLAWLAWGWGIALAIGALRGRLKVPAIAVLVVSLVAIVPSLYVGPYARVAFPASSNRSFAASRNTDLTVVWRDRLAAIGMLPQSAVLLAEPRMAYELAGLTGREVVAVPLTHTPAQIEVRDGPRRRADALDATQGRLDSASLAGVIEHYGVTNVIVDTDRTDPAAWAQLASAQILSPVASGPKWRLYRYDPTMLDGYLDLSMQAGSDPELRSSGIGPQVAASGRAVFARLEWKGAAQSARLQADALDSKQTYGRTVDLSAGSSQTFALPIPTNTPAGRYRLSLALGDGRSLALGEFEVGGLYQAEDMGGVVAGDSTGWTIVGAAIYHGGLAASTTRPGSSARQAIPPVAAGSYCAAALVYDNGTQQSSVLDVTLGDGDAQLSWVGANTGLRWVRVPIVVNTAAGQLGIRLVRAGQGAMMVDSLEIYPLIQGGACSSD